jgi:hypothetical protein
MDFGIFSLQAGENPCLSVDFWDILNSINLLKMLKITIEWCILWVKALLEGVSSLNHFEGAGIMKKLWLGGCAAVLVLALAGCDGLALGSLKGSDLAQYTEDGRRIVNLTINTGAGTARALTQALAKNAINYYEVVFCDGADYYRVAGHKGETLKLSLPAGSYLTDTAGTSAVVFAGNDPGTGEKTLLAIGKLTAPADGAITASTTSVTFTLTELATDIKAAVGTTFAIGAGAPGGGSPVLYDTVDFNGTAVPCFFVDKDTTAATATYTIQNMNTSAMATGGGTPKNFGDLIIATGPGTLTTWGLVSNEATHQVIAVDTPTVTAPAASGAAIGSTGAITLSFDTPDAVGWSFINIDIPVCALDTAVPQGTIWHIRGGLKNFLPDAGSTVNSLGGGVVLGIGSPATVSITLVGP